MQDTLIWAEGFAVKIAGYEGSREAWGDGFFDVLFLDILVESLSGASTAFCHGWGGYTRLGVYCPGRGVGGG